MIHTEFTVGWDLLFLVFIEYLYGLNENNLFKIVVDVMLLFGKVNFDDPFIKAKK